MCRGRCAPARSRVTATSTCAGSAMSAARKPRRIGSTMIGTFTAINSQTNKIAWQHKTPYRIGGGGGSTVTAAASLPRRARRQFFGARRQDRRGTVAVPDRFRRRRASGGLRGRRRAVHDHRDRRQSAPRQLVRRRHLDLLAERTAGSAVASAAASNVAGPVGPIAAGADESRSAATTWSTPTRRHARGSRSGRGDLHQCRRSAS